MSNEDRDLNIARIGLLCMAALCWKWATHLWDTGDMKFSTTGFVLGLLGSLLGLGYCVAAASIRETRLFARYCYPGLLLVVSSFALVDLRSREESGVFLSTDAHMFMDYAARLLLRGENPYAHSLLDAFRAFRAPLMLQTPLVDGDLTGRVAYPALSFIVLLPFQILGIPTRFAYGIFLFGCLLLLLTRARAPFRVLALIPFFIDDAYLNYAFGGVTDTVWAFLLMSVIAVWNRADGWRALLFGLACSYKQQPWLVAPFLLLRVFHETEGDARTKAVAAARFALHSSIPFVLVNGPFIAWGPSDWINGILEPLQAPMVTFGQGLSGLTMLGRWVVGKGAYSTLFASALVLGMWLYHRDFARLRHVVWIIPSISLWFSNRSLSSYWYLNALPLALAVLDREAVWPKAPLDRASKRRLTVAALSFATLATTVMVLAGLRRPALEIWADGPFTVAWESIQRMRVTVQNGLDEPLRPQFYVQNHVHQPVLWPIVSGLRELEPGGIGEYEIRAPWPVAEPQLTRGAIVTVAAHGSYGVRRSTVVPPHVDSRYPDAIPNGEFRYWASESNPQFWQVVRKNAPRARVRFNDEVATPTWTEIELLLPATGADANQTRTAELDTYILLPEHPVEATVYVPPGANVLPAPDLIYGMRVKVREVSYLILFGDHEGVGRLRDGTPFYGVKAPRQTWTRTVLDLRTILSALGADLRPTRMRMPRFEWLDFPMTPVNVRLSLTTSRKGMVRARFGRIRSIERAPDLDAMVAQGQKREEDIALWHALYKIDQGLGEEAADEALTKAFESPTGSNLFIAGEVAFQLKRFDAALEAYSGAREAGYEPVLSQIGMGRSLLQLKRLEEAVTNFEGAIREAKKSNADSARLRVAEALEGLAVVRAVQGDCDAATEALDERAAQVEPGTVRSMQSMELDLCVAKRRRDLDLAAERAATAKASGTAEVGSASAPNGTHLESRRP